MANSPTFVGFVYRPFFLVFPNLYCLWPSLFLSLPNIFSCGAFICRPHGYWLCKYSWMSYLHGPWPVCDPVLIQNMTVELDRTEHWTLWVEQKWNEGQVRCFFFFGIQLPLVKIVHQHFKLIPYLYSLIVTLSLIFSVFILFETWHNDQPLLRCDDNYCFKSICTPSWGQCGELNVAAGEWTLHLQPQALF